MHQFVPNSVGLCVCGVYRKEERAGTRPLVSFIDYLYIMESDFPCSILIVILLAQKVQKIFFVVEGTTSFLRFIPSRPG